MSGDTPLPDEAFVDESPRRPLLQFNNPWTACVTGVLAFMSLGLGMSIVTSDLAWGRLEPLFEALPGWAKIGLVILVVITHFMSLVGAASTLIYGLARTGDDAAVLIRGRRFSGMGLGAFYFGCYASVWLAYALKFVSRL